MKNNYSGFTLIETVLVFAAETFVIGLGVGVLFLVTETRIKESRGDSVRLAASRLADQFRTDLHAATQTSLENNSLRLTLPNNEEIVYSVEPAELPQQPILRRNKNQDNNKIATETYTLPDHSVAWFVQDKNSGLVAFNIWVQPVDRRDQILLPMPDKENLNPFTHEIADKNKIGIDPRYAANWRTIIGKINKK